jgi:hypothetical protein
MGQPVSKLPGLFRKPITLDIDLFLTIWRANPAGKAQAAIFFSSIGGNGHGATATQAAQKTSFGLNGHISRAIV